MLRMQDDGNLVLYSQDGPKWASKYGVIQPEEESDCKKGNEFERIRCGANEEFRKAGLGNVLSGSDYRVTNLTSGKCDTKRDYFPGGDIGLNKLRGEYPSSGGYSVEYGECQ